VMKVLKLPKSLLRRLSLSIPPAPGWCR
jgi:hypothetical protein